MAEYYDTRTLVEVSGSVIPGRTRVVAVGDLDREAASFLRDQLNLRLGSAEVDSAVAERVAHWLEHLLDGVTVSEETQDGYVRQAAHYGRLAARVRAREWAR